MRFRPSPATFIALLALFVALGGPAEAAKLVNGRSIKPGTITGKQVKNGSLAKGDLSAKAVTKLQRTPDDSVSSYMLRSHSVTGSKLAPASVGGAAIADGTLTGADLAPQSIGNGQLGAGSVTFTEMADNSVGKANIRTSAIGKSEMAGSSVGTGEVIDGSLTLADMAVFSGLAPVTADGPTSFGTIAAGQCASINLPVTPTYATNPLPNLSATPLIIGQPSSWPGDTLTLSGRGVDSAPGTVRLSACNLGTSPVTPGAQAVPFVIFT